MKVRGFSLWGVWWSSGILCSLVGGFGGWLVGGGVEMVGGVVGVWWFGGFVFWMGESG